MPANEATWGDGMGDKVPEVSEHPERSGEYWYPAFKLKDNPFRHFEASLEENAETVGPYIETDMERRIGALLNAKMSAIVKGPRGCGKSTLVSFGAGSKGATFIRVATPKNITDLYDKIFLLQARCQVGIREGTVGGQS